MNWLNLVAVILAVGAAILQHCIESKWHDKKTNIHKLLRNILFVATIALIIVSTIQEQKENEEQASRIEGFKEQIATLQAIEQNRENSAVEERKTLQNKINDLSSKLDPIINIAKSKYGNVTEQAALDMLINELIDKELKNRAQNIQEQKRIAPKVTPTLNVDQNGKFFIKATCENLVPIEYTWSVVTKKGIVVGGILMNVVKFYPSAERNSFIRYIDVNFSEVVENVIELRFRYNSIYAAEMNLPNLKGYIEKKYSLKVDGNTFKLIPMN